MKYALFSFQLACALEGQAGSFSGASDVSFLQHVLEIQQAEWGRNITDVPEPSMVNVKSGDITTDFDKVVQAQSQNVSFLNIETLEQNTHEAIQNADSAKSVSADSKLQCHIWDCYRLEWYSLFLSLVTLLIVMFVPLAWKQHRSSIIGEGGGGDRLPVFDNARAVSIILLVMYHFAIHCEQFYLLAGAEGSIKMVKLVGGEWKMAMLCILSGVLSQGGPTVRRLRNYFQYLVAPSVMWIVFFHLFLIDLLSGKAPLDGMMSVNFFADLFSGKFVVGEWYLSTLIIWRGAAFLFFHKLHPTLLMLLALGASGLGGYCSFGNGPYEPFGVSVSAQIMQGTCTFGYLPAFVLGYVLPLPSIVRAYQPTLVVRVLAVGFVSLWIMGCDHFFAGGGGGDPHYDYQLEVNFRGSPIVDYNLYWTRRIIRWGAGCVPALVILIVVLPRTQTFFTWIGGGTLSVYLFHHAILHWVDTMIVSLPCLKLFPRVALGLGLCFCYMGTMVLASPAWRGLFDWLLSPKWLDPFVDYLQEHFAPSDAQPAGSEGDGKGQGERKP